MEYKITPEESRSLLVRNGDYQDTAFNLTHPSSLILVSPTIIDIDGTVHRPFVEIFWNHETKQIDVRHSGNVSDAAKLFFDELGERLWNMFKDRL